MQIEYLYWICRWKNYLQTEELSADHRTVYKLGKYLICRSKKYLRIEEPSSGKKLICRSKKYLICRLRNNIQINELQIEELCADRRTKRKLKNYLQIEEPIANPRMFCRPKIYSIGRLKNDIQIKDLQIDKPICRLNNFLQIKFQSVDSSSIYR